ncbi:MAG: YkgJ family cysteine cluster protein [Myxococcus sp.]|nr:YkgJ family cysteine cluster protein [Myxococcus sp.]
MSLCLTCGLCCDGTLFRKVPLEPKEGERLGARVRLSEEDGSLCQPCRALSARRCGVYDDRPSVCRRFRCLALEQLEKGQLTEDEAHELVGEALARRRALAEVMGFDDEVHALTLARAQVAAGLLEGAALTALERLSRTLFFLNLTTTPG